MPEVRVTGLGMVSPSGLTAPQSFSSWLRCESAIGPAPAPVLELLPQALAASVPDGWQERLDPALKGADRSVQLASVAAAEALQDAKLELPGSIDTLRMGIYVGTGLAGAHTIDTLYATFYERLYRPETAGHRSPLMVHPLSVPRLMANAAAATLSIRYGIRGPTHTYSVACASSALALGEAYRAICSGWIDRALVVGCEAMLTPGAFLGWNALRVLATPDPEDVSRSCKPFDARRSGFVLGEGAAAVVLESEDSAKARAQKGHAALVGYGSASDAEHLTAPSVSGQASAMHLALADAGVDPSEVGYINAHGTATPGGDIAESASIQRVFGGHALGIPISSTKSMHGHLIGAAGALEFAGTVYSVEHGEISPTAHWSVRDPQCPLDYVAEGARRLPDLRMAISNSFAFGGTNVCLAVRRL